MKKDNSLMQILRETDQGFEIERPNHVYWFSEGYP